MWSSYVFLECTSEQLQAKIDFLEKDVSKLQSECEVLELYVLKLHPEFVDSKMLLILSIKGDVIVL